MKVSLWLNMVTTCVCGYAHTSTVVLSERVFFLGKKILSVEERFYTFIVYYQCVYFLLVVINRVYFKSGKFYNN